MSIEWFAHSAGYGFGMIVKAAADTTTAVVASAATAAIAFCEGASGSMHNHQLCYQPRPNCDENQKQIVLDLAHSAICDLIDRICSHTDRDVNWSPLMAAVVDAATKKYKKDMNHNTSFNETVSLRELLGEIEHNVTKFIATFFDTDNHVAAASVFVHGCRGHGYRLSPRDPIIVKFVEALK